MSEPKHNDDSPQSGKASKLVNSPAQRAVLEEEGPGEVGVKMSHVNEYLRDLADDNQLPPAQKANLRAHYQIRHDWLHAKLVFFEKKENIERWQHGLHTVKKSLEAARNRNREGLPPQITGESDHSLAAAQTKVTSMEKGLAKAREEFEKATSHLERGGRLPNPHILIRPFVQREAVLSSKIEGTQELLAADTLVV